MDETEYRKFTQGANEGRILVGIDRVLARRIFTGMSLSAIERATGEPGYIEKFVVMFSFIMQYLALIGALILAWFAFRSWAMLLIPVAILAWFYNASISSMGRTSIWFHNILLIAAVVVYSLKATSSRQSSGFILVYVFALWCSRFLYIAATHFLRALVLRNPRAFEAFREAITIRDPDETADN